MNTNAMEPPTSSLFTEPLAGWRKAVVTERRTAVDWAHAIQHLLDEDYAQSEKVIWVCDQLNTHKVASLYEAFKPATARRLAERLEIYHPPQTWQVAQYCRKRTLRTDSAMS